MKSHPRTNRHRLGLRALIVAATATTAVLGLSGPALSIWNGYSYPTSGDGWIVGIQTFSSNSVGFCTGTLLQQDIVLTAAHCLPVGGNGSMRVSIGPGSSPRNPAYTLAVADYRYPSGYDLTKKANVNGTNKDDVAVLRLATPANAPTIALQTTQVAVGSNVEAIGWGCTSKPKPPSTTCSSFATVAQAAHFVVSSYSTCSPNFWNPPLWQATGLCAYSKSSAINHGDSGGPLLVSDGHGGFRQVGVASIGSDNAKAVGYGGWMSVPAYVSWINSSIDSLHGVSQPPPPPQQDYCPSGDYSGSAYDGTCGTPPPPPPGPSIHLYQGGAAPAGSWYNVSMTGFAPGSQVTLTCRDSVDPGGFWTQTFTIDGAGNAGDSTLCYSGDHPDHWVTGAGYESNHLSW